MCNRDTAPLKHSSMIDTKPTLTLKPSRKTRSKTRKPKFLSLRLELTQQSGEMTTPTISAATRRQLNLFPLHPETSSVEEKDTVAYFFDSADCGATTLTTLLGTGSSSEDDTTAVSPPSLTYAYRGQDSEEEGKLLVRTALRNKERDASEEKWVCYSEVVERKDEEVTSCAADLRCGARKMKGLSLKLDYQEILNAWCDKGPLYIQLESPQTVPDLHDDSSNGLKDGWGSNGGLWAVPEYSISNGCGDSGNNIEVKEEVVLQGGGGEEWKLGQREASVLRYKEKRQNRLFSKRIRYEVRKINAEKRPRMKGRFVKRS
ncbi:hypothetical protein ACSBR2_010655 [Camellia fascicularis]